MCASVWGHRGWSGNLPCLNHMGYACLAMEVLDKVVTDCLCGHLNKFAEGSQG